MTETEKTIRQVSMVCVFDLLLFHKILSHTHTVRAQKWSTLSIATFCVCRTQYYLYRVKCNTVVTKPYHYRLLWDLCRNDVIIIPNDLGDLSSNERPLNRAQRTTVHKTRSKIMYIYMYTDNVQKRS